MENSWEIEKIFNKDISRQKRIGSNVHRRTGKGSDKAGVAGGVKFAKNNFKKYEKNSRVNELNMFEDVTSYDEFKKHDKDRQFSLLREWVKRYSYTDIMQKMFIGSKKFHDIMDDLNIIEIKRGSQMRINKKELENYKENSVEREQFRHLPDDQKFEIINHYQGNRGMNNKKVAEMLGYSYNSFNTKKSEWKKAYNNMEEGEYDMGSKHNDNFLLQGINEESQPKQESSIDQNKSSNEVKQNDKKKGDQISEDFTFTITLSDLYKGNELKDKIKGIDALLEEDKCYDISIIIKETNDK